MFSAHVALVTTVQAPLLNDENNSLGSRSELLYPAPTTAMQRHGVGVTSVQGQMLCADT